MVMRRLAGVGPYLALPLDVPVVSVEELGADGGIALSDGCGQAGVVVVPQGTAHEVVEAVALVGEFQSLLVEDEFVDHVLLGAYDTGAGIGCAVPRVVVGEEIVETGGIGVVVGLVDGVYGCHLSLVGGYGLGDIGVVGTYGVAVDIETVGAIESRGGEAGVDGGIDFLADHFIGIEVPRGGYLHDAGCHGIGVVALGGTYADGCLLVIGIAGAVGDGQGCVVGIVEGQARTACVDTHHVAGLRVGAHVGGTRDDYAGGCRGEVVGLDVGDEFSGVEVEILDEGRILCRGVVGLHLILDDEVGEAHGQNLTGEAGIAGIVEGLGQAEVDLRSTVDTDVLIGVLVDGLQVDVLGVEVEGALVVGVLVAQVAQVATVDLLFGELVGGDLDGESESVLIDVFLCDAQVVELLAGLDAGLLIVAVVGVAGVVEQTQLVVVSVSCSGVHRYSRDGGLVGCAPGAAKAVGKGTVRRVVGAVGEGLGAPLHAVVAGGEGALAALVPHDVVVVGLGCLLGHLGVLALGCEPEVEVAGDYLGGEEAELRVDVGVEGAIVGIGPAIVGLEVLDEVVADLLEVVQGVLGIGLELGDYRFCDEGHAAVEEHHLQVGPGADAVDLGYLRGKVVDAAVGVAGQRVGMCQEVVAVVDDGVEVARNVVGIVIVDGEFGNALEVGGGVAAHLHEVGTQFAKQIVAHGYALQLVEYAHDGGHGVGRVAYHVVVGIDHVLIALVEHVLAGCDTEGAEKTERTEQGACLIVHILDCIHNFQLSNFQLSTY